MSQIAFAVIGVLVLSILSTLLLGVRIRGSKDAFIGVLADWLVVDCIIALRFFRCE